MLLKIILIDFTFYSVTNILYNPIIYDKIMYLLDFEFCPI